MTTDEIKNFFSNAGQAVADVRNTLATISNAAGQASGFNNQQIQAEDKTNSVYDQNVATLPSITQKNKVLIMSVIGLVGAVFLIKNLKKSAA